MSQLYPIRRPLRLRAVLSRRLWGGERLPAALPRPADDPGGDDPVGEAWLVYAANAVAEGPHAGATLRDLAGRYGADLLGTAAVARYGATVPLLAKLIDAAQPLSIQVHPDDAWALEHERASGHLGKSEAWYVLDAAPDARVLWGFRRATDAAEVRRRVADGTLEEIVNAVPVAAGDVIYNPAGTVHAIGAGLYLFEIQQSSDLTYRLYDYNRRGADGELRELHLDRALAVADLAGGERAKVAPVPGDGGWTVLVASEHFVLERAGLERPAEASTSAASMEILVLTRGAAELHAAGETLPLVAGDALVLPATLGPYRVAGEGELLRSYLPG